MGEYGKKSISFEGTVGVEQVVGYLEGLAAAIRAGVVTLENDGESVSLRPSRTMSLAIEAKRKEEKEKISLEISWLRQSEATEPGLKIHDREVAACEESCDEESTDDDANEPIEAMDSSPQEPSMSIVAGEGAVREEAESCEEEEDENDDEEEDEKRREKKKKKKKK